MSCSASQREKEDFDRSFRQCNRTPTDETGKGSSIFWQQPDDAPDHKGCYKQVDEGKCQRLLVQAMHMNTLEDDRIHALRFHGNENRLVICGIVYELAILIYAEANINNFTCLRFKQNNKTMENKEIPRVECQMMIRKPVAQVFQAFIDPAITTNFWFTKSSGNLEVGKTVKWEWEMYNVSSDVLVKELVPDKKISIEWDNTPVTTVDFEFTALTDDTTYVVIKNYGFHQTGDDLIRAINDNTGGFTTVLDGLKAYLEYNIKLNLIADKFPKEVSNHGQ